MRRAIGISAFLIVVLVSVLVVLKKSAPAGPSVPSRDSPARSLVRISERAAEKNPLTTARVVKARLAADLQVVGSVTYDRDHYAVVGPLVSGRIVKVNASLGDPVKAGQVLAVVESADIGQAQADFLSARARANAADSNLARQKELAELKIGTAREHEVAQAQAASEKAGTRAAVERLRAFGLGAGDLERLEAGESSGGKVPLRTPIGGTVVARSVTLGQAVERATDAFVVADLSKLWVLLDLYEKDLRHVYVDQIVELRTEAAPGEVFKAHVAYVTPLVDERTRTASVRLEIERNDDRLRPGQFVTARLLADSAHGAPESLAVPRSAVQTVEGKSLVFRKKADGYEPVSVEVGTSSADLVEIRTGLAENDEVVVEGAFLLKSEYSR